jgi:sugar lactone lactonase YvrE
VAEPTLFVDGLVFPEGFRWYGGRLWLSDIHAHRVLSFTEDGAAASEMQLDDAPSGIGFLADGTPYVAMMRTCQLLRLGPDGPTVHADLAQAPGDMLNDVVFDPTGRCWVDLRADPFHYDESHKRTEWVATVGPEGDWAVATDTVIAPNGMALSPDGRTLVLAETRAHRLTAFTVGDTGVLEDQRLFAQLSDDMYPDGICMDAQGAIWVAAGFNGAVLRVHEGGAVSERISFDDRWAVTCVLGGEDRRTLYVAVTACTMELWATLVRAEDDAKSTAKGTVYSTRVAVPGAGAP